MDGHLSDRIHFTSAWMSLSLTVLLGGIGTWPQTPTPPSFTFFTSIASAVLSLRYLAATSLNAGPTIFLSTAWHAVQAFFFASSSFARAARSATPSIAGRVTLLFMIGGSCSLGGGEMPEF